MSGPQVLDKVAWHFPEGRGCPNVEAAMQHFRVVLNWLAAHELLSPLGIEAQQRGVHPDFCLSADLLTPTGHLLLQRGYHRWLMQLQYGQSPSTEFLDEALAQLSGGS